MKKTYRSNNGRYISRDQFLAEEMRRFKTYCFGLAFMAVIGIIAESNTIDVSRAPHAEAIATTTENVDLCDLKAVICENEEPVQNAITAVSDALGREITDETKKRISYLYEKATAAEVPFYDAVKTIYCESMWMSTQSTIIKNGVQEPSYGLAQIHIPSHRSITREQAMDAYFAIGFMVENWQEVAWYGYNRMSGTCTNGLVINL